MEELLLKYINGDCTEQEKIEVISWLDADARNMKEYLALRKLNDISIWQINPGASNQKPKRKFSILGGNIYVEALKIAAVFIFAFFVIKYLYPGLASQSQIAQLQTLHVPAGQRAELTLQDGTKVWLNANSTFVFPSRFSNKNRVVNLNGEGFFKVTHDKSHPFIVKTKQYDVKVWGTTFNLNAYSGSKNFTTSLLEGSVEVLRSGSLKGFMLKPNEQVSLQENQMVISPIRTTDHFLWREGIVSFNNETFAELIDKLELYFDVKIEVRNPKILTNKYTGKFRMKDGVRHILDVLLLKNKLTYKVDDELNKIIIE